jgi:hypothetical protein
VPGLGVSRVPRPHLQKASLPTLHAGRDVCFHIDNGQKATSTSASKHIHISKPIPLVLATLFTNLSNPCPNYFQLSSSEQAQVRKINHHLLER